MEERDPRCGPQIARYRHRASWRQHTCGHDPFIIAKLIIFPSRAIVRNAEILSDRLKNANFAFRQTPDRPITSTHRLAAVECIPVSAGENTPFVLAIDAGHGGRDLGTSGRRLHSTETANVSPDSIAIAPVHRIMHRYASADSAQRQRLLAGNRPEIEGKMINFAIIKQ